jgi:uncharacterized protein YndB with AHSA1/START domain
MSKFNIIIDREALAYTATLIFDAPRELVWRVYTDPASIPRWWGPRRLTTVVDKMDVRLDGLWRYVQTDTDGNTYAFNGTYKEVDPPCRLVSTFEFEGAPGHIMTETIVFEAMPDGKTKLVARSAVSSLEELEAIVTSGMEEGALETWERFGELLAALQATHPVG